nr:hypothetical protein Iba_chr04dCG8090 [Ipomoea batatas]
MSPVKLTGEFQPPQILIATCSPSPSMSLLLRLVNQSHRPNAVSSQGPLLLCAVGRRDKSDTRPPEIQRPSFYTFTYRGERERQKSSWRLRKRNGRPFRMHVLYADLLIL